MLKLEVCGLGATKTTDIIKKQFAGQVEVINDADRIAVRKVKNGEADYYLGSCETGGGASLAAAFAVLGFKNCLTVSRQGLVPDEKKIRHMIYGGTHKAFGYVHTHTEKVVPALVQALLDKAEGKPE